MSAASEIIRKDKFIQMLNTSNPTIQGVDELQEKWIFGVEEQNPFLPTFDFFSGFLPQKKIKKEEEIICKNKELFNVNQSKSIYLSKINSLIDTDITPKSKRANEKWKKKLSQPDSSEDQFTGSHYQQKLARNRQSARDSRKRKKIYIELLENKVEDLAQEMNRLQNTIAHQNTYINYCAKIPSMIKDFHTSYSQQLRIIQEQPTQQQLSILEQEYGTNALRRVELCNSFFNTLIDHIIPNDLKKFMEQATKNNGLFANNPQLKEQQNSLKEDVQRLEFYLFDLAKNYEKIRSQTQAMENTKKEIIQKVGTKQYIRNVISNSESIEIKEEELDQSSSQS